MILKANAKINLTLDILSKRADGYHNIRSVMQSVSLCDTVSVEKSDKISVLCKELKALPQEKNTAYTAAKRFFEFTKISGGAKIEIIKSIPSLAGLGGGSADAAAVITALDKLYDTHLSQNDIITVASLVGADVPFCTVGGTALCEGTGEIITPIKPLCDCGIVIVKLGNKLSTGYMYSMADGNLSDGTPTGNMINAINSGNLKEISKNLSNSFMPFADCESALGVLGGYAPLGVSVSGSGPCVFGIFEDKARANRVHNEIADKTECYYCTPSNSGVIFE